MERYYKYFTITILLCLHSLTHKQTHTRKHKLLKSFAYTHICKQTNKQACMLLFGVQHLFVCAFSQTNFTRLMFVHALISAWSGSTRKIALTCVTTKCEQRAVLTQIVQILCQREVFHLVLFGWWCSFLHSSAIWKRQKRTRTAKWCVQCAH